MPESVRRASVKVPLAVVTGEAYNDLAFVFAAKVGHLAAGPGQPGCIADLTTIARYLGLTVRSVPQPDGRVALKAPSSLYAAQKQLTAGEELTVVRRTKRSGTGTSAVRRLRPLYKGEPWVVVPVALLGAVPHRHARAYAVICYSRARGHHLTYAELAQVLRHQSGRRIGEPVSVRAARGVVSDLERWGWVEVGRREGWQGRNMLIPLRPFEPVSERDTDNGVETTGEVCAAIEPVCGIDDFAEIDPGPQAPNAAVAPDSTAPVDEAEIAGGTGCFEDRGVGPEGQWTSGSQGVGTSVTDKEDTPTDLRRTPDIEGGSARRASCVGSGPEPVDNFAPAAESAMVDADPAAAAPTAEPRGSRRAGSSRNRTTISVTAVRAFAEITPLVAAMSAGQRVVAARLVERAVAEVGDPERVFARLANRWRTQEAPVAAPLGWLGGRGLVRRGCADPNCEDGRLWLPTTGPGIGGDQDGYTCRNCARQTEDRRASADARFGADRRAENRRTPARYVAVDASVGTPIPAAPEPMGTCDGCDRAVRGLRADRLCADCREEQESAPSAAARPSWGLQSAF
ncbi:hypothetical protein [Streptomyces sp. SID3343]|uniref:hypothetical protein n=1 Tax=Streptomyces sp. SID3343 TaxID=2690260 RepID=UPI0013687D1A|nr:hypothetical protein [Streptomyces sp. SID3343]MYV97588.1 hypothetical protein [Streptomyces sp. SID3343]MYW06434.1 hypothetical protein [Streptomyces sp. SID3343]